MSKKRGRTESQDQAQALAEDGLKKAAKRPQVFMIGDGFPVELKNAFDILSPHPISGIRVPIQQLFQEIHKMALGTSRLGPLTAEQFKNDLRAPYATMASNALLMGMILTFAQMERSRIVAFSFNRSKFLKALMRYFDLERIEGLGGIFSSGRIPEPPDFAIPYGPEKYQPENLTQMTQSLAKWTETTRETLMRHQKEWDDFNKNTVPIVSERVLRESPATKELDALISDLKNHPRVKENPELLEVSKNVDSGIEEILKEHADEIKKSTTPLSDKELDMVKRSYAERGLELPEDQAEKAAAMARMKGFLSTIKTESKFEVLTDISKRMGSNMDNLSLPASEILEESRKINQIRKDSEPDISLKTGVMGTKAKNFRKVEKKIIGEMEATQKKEIDIQHQQGEKLQSDILALKSQKEFKADIGN